MSLTISAYEDSASVSTSEYSFPNDTTSGVPGAITTDGIYWAAIYIASMAAGDQFRIRVYEKILGAGTQRTFIDFYVDGPQSAALLIPPMPLGNGWDITGLKISGTDRTIEWRISSLT